MKYLPADLKITLNALFTYRNRMLHHGLEWPSNVRIAFGNFIKGFPSTWFSSSTSGGDPWIFYMTEDFVPHLLKTVEKVFEAMTKYSSEVLYPRFFPDTALK